MTDLIDTSARERTQLFKRLTEGKTGSTRILRKISNSRRLVTEIESKKTPAFKEIDIFAAIKSRKSSLAGLADILIPNQAAVHLFSEAIRDSKRTLSPYTPFLRPKLTEAPWVIQDPDYTRACENGKAR